MLLKYSTADATVDAAVAVQTSASAAASAQVAGDATYICSDLTTLMPLCVFSPANNSQM